MHGYMNGSGLPMPFVDEQGTVVPVHQQVTSLVDEQLLPLWGSSEQLTTAEALAISRELIDNSQNAGYSAIAVQAHVDGYAQSAPWVKGTMDYAASLGIPLWSAERWLKFTTARAATTVTSLTWVPAEKQLSFQMTVPAGSEPLSVVLPSAFGTDVLVTATVDGAPVSVSANTINGRGASFFSVGPAAGGAARSVVVWYGVPPPNTPPVARDDTATTNAETSVTVSVLSNDSDPDGDTLTVSAAGQPSHGATSVVPGGSGVSYSPQTGFCGADSFTYTVTDGRGGTANAQVMVSVVCSGGTRTHSTVADFSGCSTLVGTQVSQTGDGEVWFAGAQGDDYSGSALNAQWTTGTWNGGTYAPVLSGGILMVGDVAGAYVRSTTAWSGSVVSARVRFSASKWEHIGWGSLDFSGNVYALVSTYSGTTNLYARTNAGDGEQQTDLGPIPIGFHDYQIQRVTVTGGTEEIRYLVDGALRASHTVSALPEALYLYQSNAGGSGPTLDVDAIWVSPPYVANGTFDSCIVDAGYPVTWIAATWNAVVPANTSLAFRTRTSLDAETWSDWSAPLGSAGQPITSPLGRYMQYRFELATTDTAVSPVVDSVTVSYGPGEATLTVDDVSAVEGTGGTAALTFTVRLSPSSTSPVTVQYATSDVTATAGADYYQASGTLTFAPGVTAQTITVETIGDVAVEPSETLAVTLSAASGALIGKAVGVGTIIDDDAPPVISIGNVQVGEGNSGSTSAVFTLTLSRSNPFTVTVDYATADVTATAGADYTGAAGTVTFAPGATTQTISVAVTGDTTPEPSETFTVDLTNPQNAILGNTSGVAIIVDDDNAVRTDALVLVNANSAAYRTSPDSSSRTLISLAFRTPLLT